MSEDAEAKTSQEPTPFDRILNAVAKLIEEKGDKIVDGLLGVLNTHVSEHKQLEKMREEHWYSTIKFVSVLAIVFLVAMSLLAYFGKLSSDAISFLLGTVAGYLFSILGGLVGQYTERK